jgi:HlyD family secretion protein
MKKVIVIISVLAIAAGVAVWFYISDNKSKAPAWKIATIDTGSLSVNVTATGSLNAVTTVLVGAQVSGIVSRLLVDFNSVVTKGQIIALLDTTLLHAAMRDALAAVEKARVQVELAKKQFARTDTLFREKVAAQADYDIAYGNFRSAQADLLSRLAVLDHEKTNLHYATIKAPINGTVISRNVDVGQTVISSFNAPTLFTIANDLTQMQVLANVDEADIGQIKVGQETVFSVDAYPYEVFNGIVAQIRLQPVVVQNVNNYIVVINVANPDLKLLPGLTASIVIKIYEHRQVLKVTVNAIHFIPASDAINSLNLPDSLINKIQLKKIPANEIPKAGTECYVWVRNGSTLSPKAVQTGLFDGTFIELTGDIKRGDEIVIGTSSTGQSTSATSNNPFMPKMPPRRTLR